MTDAVTAHGVTTLPAFHFFKGGKALPGQQPILGYKKTPLKTAVEALAKS